MRFFQSIEALNIGGNVTIIITKNADNTFTTTTAIQHKDKKAAAFRAVIPLNVTGTAGDLDSDYFMAFGEWMVKEDKALVSNVQEVEASYKKAQEKAKQSGTKPAVKAAVGKIIEDATDVDTPAINPEYKKAMEKVASFIEKKNYGQARNVLPDPKKYPAYEAEIAEVAKEIYKNRPDLLF